MIIFVMFMWDGPLTAQIISQGHHHHRDVYEGRPLDSQDHVGEDEDEDHDDIYEFDDDHHCGV